MPVIYGSEDYLPWRIASSIWSHSRWHGSVGTCFGFALGMRLKKMLGWGWDPLPSLSQSGSWKLPRPPTNQKAAPTSLGDCGLSTIALSPRVPMHLVTPDYGGQWNWTPSCDLCISSLWPQGRGKCGHEFKESVDKGCVFHQLACLTCFIFCEIVSLKKKKKKTFITEICTCMHTHIHRKSGSESIHRNNKVSPALTVTNILAILIYLPFLFFFLFC